MKAYTTIEQSKKLIKILPIESADMCYLSKDDRGIEFFEEPVVNDGTRENDDIPCWSLATLLNYIKDKCGYFELVYLSSTIDGRANILKNVYRFSTDIYDIYQKEAIDACYEMILKLYELKLL